MINSRKSFNFVPQLRERILANKNSKDIPILIVGKFFFKIGNKKDQSVEEREVTYEEGHQSAQNYGIKFLESSAKTGENIEVFFINIFFSLFLKQL